MTSVGEILRNNAVSKILKYVSIGEAKAKDLEQGIFNWTIEYCDKKSLLPNWNNEIFRKIYDDKFISILTNLDMESELKNVGLLNRMLNNEFKPHDIPYMEPHEIFPERWISIISSKLKKEQSLIESNSEAKTDMFKCGRCKQKKCSYYEMQVRSADESSTIFITCMNCKNKWRIG
jgi:DNA-directed RNA polymerase subunit M/transcription elongation factor TFIIS